jgi:hypothetical protein
LVTFSFITVLSMFKLPVTELKSGAIANLSYGSSGLSTFDYLDQMPPTIDFPGMACGSPGLRHANVRSAIHSRAVEFNKTHSHDFPGTACVSPGLRYANGDSLSRK